MATAAGLAVFGAFFAVDDRLVVALAGFLVVALDVRVLVARRVEAVFLTAGLALVAGFAVFSVGRFLVDRVAKFKSPGTKKV